MESIWFRKVYDYIRRERGYNTDFKLILKTNIRIGQLKIRIL